jgi:hypothetical protein
MFVVVPEAWQHFIDPNPDETSKQHREAVIMGWFCLGNI